MSESGDESQSIEMELILSGIPSYTTLPDELWAEVAKRLDDNNLFAFAMTCKKFLKVKEEVKPKDEAQARSRIMMNDYFNDPKMPLTSAWLRWAYKVCGNFFLFMRFSR